VLRPPLCGYGPAERLPYPHEKELARLHQGTIVSRSQPSAEQARPWGCLWPFGPSLSQRRVQSQAQAQFHMVREGAALVSQEAVRSLMS
jgi:hypothetical protein